MTRIGVVGLGTMGGRIAGRLIANGHTVQGTNRTRAKAEEQIAAGLLWCETPRAAAEGADVVISMVSDDAALSAVTEGPDGILAGLTSGSVYIDMSTVSPRASSAPAEKVAAHGASMVAAPVSGSVPAVESGTLTIMVGGQADAFERALPVLRELGSTVTHVGDVEHALLLKLAINISLAVQMLAFSEGVLLAEQGGVESGVALEVMTGSAIGSPMLQARAPMMHDLPEQAWFDVSMMLKDLRMALDYGLADGLPMSSSVAAYGMLRTAEKLGYAHDDLAVLYRTLTESRTR